MGIGAIALILGMGACDSGNSHDEEEQYNPIFTSLTRAEQQSVDANNRFAYNIFNEVFSDPENESNIVISPQSMAWVLSMAANAANGETRAQILSTLGFEGDMDIDAFNEYNRKMIEGFESRKGSSSLDIANLFAYWPSRNQFNVKAEFLATLAEYYKAGTFKDPTLADFDRFVSENTSGMIQNFGSDNSELFEDALFMFLNTLYLKADFGNENFDEKNTKEDVFNNIDGTEGRATYIGTRKHLRVAYDDICGRLDMPVGNICISFLLPMEGKSISDVVTHLNEQTWKALGSGQQLKSVDIKVPRLNYSWKFEFEKYLKKLGIEDAFTIAADFTNAFDRKDKMCLNRALQDTRFELNEKGVKSSSVTIVEGISSGIIPDGGQFYCDEPFIYVVSECSSGAILFMGAIRKM